MEHQIKVELHIQCDTIRTQSIAIYQCANHSVKIHFVCMLMWIGRRDCVNTIVFRESYRIETKRNESSRVESNWIEWENTTKERCSKEKCRNGNWNHLFTIEMRERASAVELTEGGWGECYVTGRVYRVYALSVHKNIFYTWNIILFTLFATLPLTQFQFD